MKVVLMGEAPIRGTTTPFEGNAGKHLFGLAGDNLKRIHPYNLFLHPKPRGVTESAFPYNRAKAEAARLTNVMDGQQVVLLLAGHRMARAFGVKAHYFEACLVGDSVVTYVVPHPSGSNRWYGNEFNRFKARQFFDALFLALDGGDYPDGSLDDVEFRVLARAQATEAGRVF